jgi:choline-sulfatase
MAHGDDGTPQAGFTYWCTDAEKGGGYRNPTFFKNGKTIKIDGFSEDAITDAGLEFIDANQDKPFLLYLPYHAPHSGYGYQPEQYRKPYYDRKFTCFPSQPKHPQRRRSFEKHHGNRDSMIGYAALITAVDHNVGRIIRRLEELGIREDTLIVFTGDNGWNAGHHGVWGKGNATIPFNMYEGSIGVPLIWNQPGRIKENQVFDEMVSSYDFFPSILDYLGLDVPADRQRVGRSYAPLLRGERPSSRSELIFEYCYTRAIRTEKWKYVQRWCGEGDLNPHEITPASTSS